MSYVATLIRCLSVYCERLSECGEIHGGLKTKIVKPLLKAGNVGRKENDSPISILPCLALGFIKSYSSFNVQLSGGV